MDYINYVKQSPMMGQIGLGGGATSLGRYRSAGARWYGVRGIMMNSVDSSGDEDEICYITAMSTGNATDFGNLTAQQRSGRAGGGGPTRAVCSGNHDTYPIDYITIATTGNAQDFGDMGTRRIESAFCGNGTRGIFAGGQGNPGAKLTSMEFITLETTGNASNYGTLTTELGPSNSWVKGMTGTSDATRGLIAGGGDAPSGDAADAIRYITVDTNGNSSDFGNLLAYNANMGAGTSGAGRAVFGGGGHPLPSIWPITGQTNVIQYVTVQSTGNATDFGNLTEYRRSVGGLAGGPAAERAVFCGGYKSPSRVNTMDYVTIANTGNASNFGDMIVSSTQRQCCSGDA